VLVVLMLIPFHTAMTFAPYPWYLRNSELNQATQGLINVLDQYHMELLFFIAGAAAFFSLGVRSGKGYAVERLRRLVIPLVFGMLVLVPSCYWVADVQFSGFQGSFFEWYPTFLRQSLTPFHDNFGPGALWFLWYLVLYTALLFPVFLLIRRKFGETLIPRLAGFFEKRGALFLLVIPVALVEMYSTWIIHRDFLVLYYVIFFVCGFFFFSDARFQRGIDKSGPIAIVGAIITMTFYMLLIFPQWNTSVLGPAFWTNLSGEPGTWGYIIFRILISFTTLFWIIAILYLARRFLNFSNRFLRYGNEAVLPYYLIHSTPIALIGLYVIQWDMGVGPKYAINTVLAFLATVGLYELIKRTNVTRFLFGMRLKKPGPDEEAVALPYEGPLALVAGETARPATSPGDSYYIVCEDLFKIYKIADLEVVALRGLDLTVKAGELMAIVGASGSGKTTLLNILGGLDVPSAGKVVVGKRDLLKTTSRDLVSYRRQDVGFVWQQTSRNVIPYFSAFQNVELPLILLGWPQKKRQHRAEEMLEVVGLADRMDHIPDRLSGGEQQRVAIAVALAHNPPLLLADEPTGELDSQTSETILDVFRSLNDAYGVTVVIVTHDIRITSKVDRIVTIRDGRTSLEAVRKQPQFTRTETQEAYEEFIVVDGAGRLQIPRNLLDQLKLGRRAKVLSEGDHLTIWPAEGEEA